MKHVIQTGLDFDNSKYALTEAFKVYGERYKNYNPTFEWKNDKLALFGFKVSGTKIEGMILVDEGMLILDMNVPWIARPFQSKAIETIENEVKIWVERIKKENSSNMNRS